MSQSNFWNYFNSRDELLKNKNKHIRWNALGLIAAEMRSDVDDILQFANEYLTDHSNDHKCDLVFFDNDYNKLVIVQSYYSPNGNANDEANSNKASDMVVASSWLLDGNLQTTTDKLENLAKEAREKIRNGEIQEIELWYVHNFKASVNVQHFLDEAKRNTDSLLREVYSKSDINVRAIEIDRSQLEKDYERLQSSILVSDENEFMIAGGFELINDSKWKSFITAVSLEELKAFWQKYKLDLLAPNIRNFLGIRKSQNNINFGIQRTLEQQPENFAIYNNGITVLVNDYEVNEDNKKILIRGAGIVNGGQTTGSIGSYEDNFTVDGNVIVRFIKSTDNNILDNIIKYNNTQNVVKPADFRSNDEIQKNLRKQFEETYSEENIIYNGARRGDAIRRNREIVEKTLDDKLVAQSLVSFHGDPNLAYNRYKFIWENEENYRRYFKEITARHILFTCGLLKSIEETKNALSNKGVEGRTEQEEKAYGFLVNRGSQVLLATAISNSLESILGSKIHDKKALHFDINICKTISDSVDLWTPIVQNSMNFYDLLLIDKAVRISSRENVKIALENFDRSYSTLVGLRRDDMVGDDFIKAVKVN
ncbi:AIPR family protein [Rothia amarae]|uniref:AIPR family protein n=1 Tax=Rothia amarae TaxID=169480 RepID=A0A7H2BMJ0_9MICC|nr:AIPR family protein [Rothia amarae]QNV40886.1 AIPR family protein [Rothia amarae]